MEISKLHKKARKLIVGLVENMDEEQINETLFFVQGITKKV